MKILKILTVILTALLFSCDGGSEIDPIATPAPKPAPKPVLTPVATTLKSAVTFPIGMIVSANRLSGNDTNFTNVLNKEFNSVTAENDMKMGAMFTGPNTYDFSKGDAIVAYAKANGMRVHGHALVWHSSIPTWLRNFTGTDAEFEAHVKAYVKTTVAHFAKEKTASGKSVVESWDVVNEAFTIDGYAGPFFKRIPNYVAKCFIWAREADPNVKLFYNDYNLENQGSKVNDVVNMVNSFRANSTPIDGIGLQMHVDYITTNMSTLATNLNTIKNTGLLIHFSELDMTVNMSRNLTSLTSERALAQKARYKDIAVLYKSIPTAQRFGISIWGLRDNESWLLSFHNNSNEWPLLYDANYEQKPAYVGFLEGLNQK